MNRHTSRPSSKGRTRLSAIQWLRRALVVAACAAMTACGPATGQGGDGKDQTGTTKQDLYYLPDYRAWPNGVVDICYDPYHKNPNLYALMQRIFNDTWGRAANVSLNDWGQCTWPETTPPLPNTMIVAVSFLPSASIGGGEAGQTTFRGWEPNFYNFVSLLSDDTTAPTYTVFTTAVIHEFGHVLGFAHEQERPDNWKNGTAINCDITQGNITSLSGGTYETSAYDPYSIMDYCWNLRQQLGVAPVGLSPGDISGVRKVYGRNTKNHGFMITSDANPKLALNAWGGAKEGTLLALYGSCTSSKTDCTWTYWDGMLLSDTDPTLAINAWGGAQQGTVLKLTRLCLDPRFRGDKDCTWTYKRGMFISDSDPTLAISVQGTIQSGSQLTLSNQCNSFYDTNCTWTSHGVMFTSDADPVVAMNAYGGATDGVQLAPYDRCQTSSPDCTFTISDGMIISDRDPTLAVNGWGGAVQGAQVVLTRLCALENSDCRWTWHQGFVESEADELLDITLNSASNGTGMTLDYGNFEVAQFSGLFGK